MNGSAVVSMAEASVTASGSGLGFSRSMEAVTRSKGALAETRVKSIDKFGERACIVAVGMAVRYKFCSI